ncbi:MAG: hypothetical protein JSS98_00880 [Bacteroidetes bacterium]|nr:hypothetical protein [Bacteroidota bacterium]
MENDIIIKGDAMDKMLQRLKLVDTKGADWLFYYLDEKKDEKWVKEYPNSSYHGGGEPQLRMIKKFPWENK